MQAFSPDFRGFLRTSTSAEVFLAVFSLIFPLVCSLQLSFCILPLVCSLHFTPGPQSAIGSLLYTDRRGNYCSWRVISFQSEVCSLWFAVCSLQLSHTGLDWPVSSSQLPPMTLLLKNVSNHHILKKTTTINVRSKLLGRIFSVGKGVFKFFKSQSHLTGRSLDLNRKKNTHTHRRCTVLVNENSANI